MEAGMPGGWQGGELDRERRRSGLAGGQSVKWGRSGLPGVEPIFFLRNGARARQSGWRRGENDLGSREGEAYPDARFRLGSGRFPGRGAKRGKGSGVWFAL